ncbi:MAG: beta-lactamase family protein, partial [Victivallales bacterium]|nr:beta-lactamase family protein [Victivallales bacterium]
MKIGTLIIALMLLSGFSMESMGQPLQYAKPEETGLSSGRLDRINTLMDRYVADREISGAVTLVARHGEIAHFEAHGFRDVESQSPMRRDTVFRIASMTKIFTSVAAMMLYEEGKFLLTDPVSEYIHELGNATVLVPAPYSYEHAAASGYAIVPAKREMTVRHLLNHTSGLTSGLWKRPWINDIYNKELGGEATLGERMR